MWEKTNTIIKSILEANTYLTKVYDFEASELEGTPIATLTPSSNENAYHSTTENRRRYVFVIRLFVKRLSGESNENTTEKAMRELVDSVIDDFDKNHRLTGLVVNDGYSYLYMRATPSRWGYVGRENEYRVAEIELSVDYDVDVNIIS